jgi:2'-hydroxyisoflavone reductase
MALAESVNRYHFISSISVYRPKPEAISEDDPVSEPFDGMSLTEMSPENYGPLKVLCEREVQRLYGDRATIVRPGLVVGPGDYTDRFSYWPHRLQAGGDVLVPDIPKLLWQCIDGRDLGEFVVGLLERQTRGVFSATGPAEPRPMRENLERLRATLNRSAHLVWVDVEFLRAQGVQEWSEMPFVVYEPEEGLIANVSKAVANGLRFRPMEETAKDVLAWRESQPEKPLAAGLSDERHAELLDAWKARA